jgi:NitT/TauT family transport system substrate-binding protein
MHMTIRLIENFRALFYAPFYAAQAIGAYRDAGVSVEILSSASPAEAAAALRAGRADAMWGGPLRVLGMAQDDPAAEFVCFCNVVERDPFFVIGRMPHPGFTVADLAGRVFASVSEVPTPWLCLQDDLRRAGVSPSQVRRRTGLSMEQSLRALMNGEVEAIQTFQPYAEELIRSGAGYLWYAAASRGLTAYTTLVTTRANLAARGDEFARMVRAMAHTLRWMAATPAAVIAETLRDDFPNLPQPVFAAAIARYQDLRLWASSPVLAPEGFERLQGAMLSGGALRAHIDFDMCVDNSLALAS